MSRERNVKRTVWWDQNGTEYEINQRQTQPPGPQNIDKAARLVDIHDSAEHLLAVLARSSPTDQAVIYLRGSTLAPVLVLTDEGFAVAVVTSGDLLGTLPGARDRFELACPTCQTDHEVTATQLREAIRMKTRPGKTPCLHV